MTHIHLGDVVGRVSRSAAWSITLAISGVWSAAPPTLAAGPGDNAESPVERALELLAEPAGSLSVRTTNDGALRRAARLADAGPGWAVFPHFRKRRSAFGTDELVALVAEVAGAMADHFPGSTLGVGNLSVERGGQTGGSVSHKAGRDADLGFYARSANGDMRDPTAFVSYGEDGADDGGKGYVFDVERNLALVELLLSEPEHRVQWIFVADWLKALLLERARARATPDELVARIEEVLLQPSDSNPHQHHFHVRLQCSDEDRLHGCLDRPPLRAWIPRDDEGWLAHVDAIARTLVALEGREPALRAGLLDKLGRLRAHAAMWVLVAHVDDPAPEVREAALGAVAALANPWAAPGLLEALARADDAEHATELVEALAAIDHEAMRPVIEGFVGHPGYYLRSLHGDEARERALPKMLTGCVRFLAVHGRREAARLVTPLVKSDSRELRRVSHEALRRITHQDFPAPRGDRVKEWDALYARWAAFLAEHMAEPWTEWLRIGFALRGVVLPEPLEPVSKDTVLALIAAVGDRREVVSHNAARLLGELTGHVVDPRWRNRRNNSRHWRSWWRKEGAARFDEPDPTDE